MKAKTKYKITKWVLFFAIPLYVFIITSIFALLKIDDIWGNMFNEGITSGKQWITLILYRLLIYVPLPWIIGIVAFDKRYKYMSRVIIWYNWMFFVYLIFYSCYDILAIDLILDVKGFNTLSAFVLILGYLFTYIKKKTISFDDTNNIIKKY